MLTLITTFALIAVVLIVAALASGFITRSPISFPMFFLGLGFALGPRALGLVSVGPHSGGLEAIGVLTLALVLFIDGLKLKFDEVGNHWVVPVLILGPGTLLTIGILTGLALALFGVSLSHALLIGGVLASSDPVVLRDVLRDDRIPRSIRRVLGVEAGANDMVTLPTVLILIELARGTGRGPTGWIAFLATLLLLGPLIGAAIGWVGAWAMERLDGWIGVAREWQALYGIGLVLASYAAGELAGSSGFVAAFAAGVTVSISSFELCDCFVEYGEVTSEVAMLLTFILFGAVLSTLLGTIAIWPALAFAALAIVVARPAAMSIALRGAVASRRARAFIGWFGPRGLSSLLLALLVVERDVPQATRLLAIVGVVVIVSVVVHGASAAPLAALYARTTAGETMPEERESTASGFFRKTPGQVPRITPEALASRLAGANSPYLLDVRTRSQHARDPAGIPGSIRVEPDHIVEWANGKEHDRAAVAYCT